MKLVTRTLAALAAVAACTPLGSAHAETPLACVGDPAVPASYVCVIRFQFGFDGAETYTVAVPPQTVTTPQSAEVPPQTIPGQTVTTPGVVQQLPWTSVTVPGISESVEFFDLTIPYGAIVVAYHSGVCYYAYPDATYTTAFADSPSQCP